jgi:hypothetical protein
MQALWSAARMAHQRATRLLTGALADGAPEVRGEAVRLLGELLPREVGRRDEARLQERATKDPSAYVRMQAILQLKTRPALEAVVQVLADADPFLMGAALTALGQAGNSQLLTPHLRAADVRLRLGVLLALRRAGDAEGRQLLPRFLADPDPAVRRAAIQWVGEERLQQYASRLGASAARAPVTREVFEALLASQAFLSGKPGEETSGEEYMARVVKDASQPAAFRALALRMLRPDDPALKTELLRSFLEGKDGGLRREAVRTLVLRSDDSSQELLRRLAAGRLTERASRAEAVMGLGLSAGTSAATRRVLLALLPEQELRRAALESLRAAADRPDVERAILRCWDKFSGDPAGSREERRELAAQVVLALQADKTAETARRLKAIGGLAGPRPEDEAGWRSALAQGGDPVAGERVFFHAQGPRCFSCHRVDGRGGLIGPDLSTVGRSLSRDKLIESILRPSKEIAPQFVTWLITTRDGKVRTGVILDEGPDSTVTIGGADGKIEIIHRTTIEDRRALPTSLMPDRLPALMTPREFLDLIAFLKART